MTIAIGFGAGLALGLFIVWRSRPSPRARGRAELRSGDVARVHLLGRRR
jgi:hypothetical protein